MDIFNQLTRYVEQQDLLQNKDYNQFDLSIAIAFQVLAHLSDHKPFKKKAYEYGFEKPMLKDQRIMTLAYHLLAEAQNFSKEKSPCMTAV